jgi:hypothetical protein
VLFTKWIWSISIEKRCHQTGVSSLLSHWLDSQQLNTFVRCPTEVYPNQTMIKGSVEICRSESPKICPNFLQPCGNQCCLEVKDWKGEIHLRWQKSVWGQAQMLLTFQVSNCYSTFNLWSPFFVFYCIFVTIFRTLPPFSSPAPSPPVCIYVSGSFVIHALPSCISLMESFIESRITLIH